MATKTWIIDAVPGPGRRPFFISLCEGCTQQVPSSLLEASQQLKEPWHQCWMTIGRNHVVCLIHSNTISCLLSIIIVIHIMIFLSCLLEKDKRIINIEFWKTNIELLLISCFSFGLPRIVCHQFNSILPPWTFKFQGWASGRQETAQAVDRGGSWLGGCSYWDQGGTTGWHSWHHSIRVLRLAKGKRWPPYPPTPWSPKAKGKARGEAVHGRDTKVRRELRWSGEAYLALRSWPFFQHFVAW